MNNDTLDLDNLAWAVQVLCGGSLDDHKSTLRKTLEELSASGLRGAEAGRLLKLTLQDTNNEQQ